MRQVQSAAVLDKESGIYVQVQAAHRLRHSAGPEGDGERRPGSGPADRPVIRLGSPRPALLRLHAAGEGRACRYCRIGRTAWQNTAVTCVAWMVQSTA